MTIAKTVSAALVARLKSVLSVGKVVLGVAWAMPVTLVNLLLHVGPMMAIGGYEFVGVRHPALVFALRSDAPKWLRDMWRGWGGNAAGNVIVLREHPDKWNSAKTLVHELEHVRQCMRLGVAQPIAYALCSAVIWVGCPQLSPYRGNPFEVSARMAAVQPISDKLLRR